MLKQEFENMIGTEVSTNTFDYANRVYMAAGEMDKQTFARDWQDEYVSESKIVSALTLEVECLQDTVKNLEHQVQDDATCLNRFRDQMVDFLVLQAHKWSATDLREKAIKIVGIREYLRRCIEMKLDLWEADRIAILDILKED